MNKNLEIFAQNLKELMGDMTISELAKRVNIPQPTLSRYILCQREISIDNLIKLADFFHEDIDFLLGRKEY